MSRDRIACSGYKKFEKDITRRWVEMELIVHYLHHNILFAS